MQIKQTPFNVTLLEKIGETAMREAWLTSKPTLTYKNEEELQSYLDNVIDNDLPLTGFHNFALKIGSSIFFRDLIISLRPIQVWATSSRIAKIVNLGLEGTEYSEKTRADFEKVAELQESGESLDYSKRWCPLQQYTEFCCVLDLRTLLVFCKTVALCDNKLFESHCLPILEACKIPLDRFVKMKAAPIYQKLSVPEEMQREVEAHDGVFYQETTTSYELGVNVAMSLGAQFLRQHYARVRFSGWNLLKEKGYKWILDNCNSASKFYYVSVGEKEQWRQVCSRRTCFVAQFDWSDEFGWDSIIGKWVNKLPLDEFKKNLPCGGCGGRCNIFNETKLRLYSKRPESEAFKGNKPDENPPCPLLIEAPSMIELRRKMYHSNSLIFEKWKEFVNHYIKDNPDNEARKFYENRAESCPDSPEFLLKENFEQEEFEQTENDLATEALNELLNRI